MSTDIQVRRLAHPGQNLLPQPEHIVYDTANIVCIIPAYNEEEGIKATIQSILDGTRVPSAIHVVVNNSSDETFWRAKELAGVHETEYKGVQRQTEVIVHDMGKNPEKKVGALNYGYAWSAGADFILGVDADTVVDRFCLEHLENEMVADDNIGGISAIYTLDINEGKNMWQKLLITAQRAQFAGFTMDNLLRKRNMAVLGGQASLLSVSALEEVKRMGRRQNPWMHDSAVEDSLLSLHIRDAQFKTKVSSEARATVGAMTSLGSLHAQQVKWVAGAFELMKSRPFHANLWLRWKEAFSMFFNIGSRLSFVLLLVASLSFGAFVFNPIWLIPVGVAWALNLRVAFSMKNTTAYDFWFAFLFFPAEIYMLIRMNHFVVSLRQVLGNQEKDTWAAQASAEKGGGGMSTDTIWTLLGFLVLFGSLTLGWFYADDFTKSTILYIGWWTLATVSVLLTLTMGHRLFRSQKKYKV